MAVVLQGTEATLFLDGAEVASAAVTGDPSDMGVTPNNWLGRSQYAQDANLDGRLDEVHISTTRAALVGSALSA